MARKKSSLPHLEPYDHRVTAAVIKQIREMPFSELQERLAHRNPGVVERQYPDPTPVTREELLRRQNQTAAPHAEHSLREALQEWTDWDGAAYALAVCLGMMPDDIFATCAKHVFWSNNPVGNQLYAILDRLAAAGVLEKRDEPDVHFRWNPEFRGSWEISGAVQQPV